MTKKFFGKFLLIPIFFCMMIYCGKSNGPKTIKFDYQVSEGQLKIDLFIQNLKESARYVLCLNGKEGQDGNEAICNSGSKKYGPIDCYIDFKTVLSDQEGNLYYHGTVPLVKAKYDVTFLIKDVEADYKPVFVWNHCIFEITK